MSNRVPRYVTLPFWAATFCLLGLTILVAWYVYAVNLELSVAVEADVDSLEYAQELALSAREIRTHLNRFLLTDDVENLDAIPAIQAEAHEWLTKATSTIRTDLGKSYIAQVTKGLEQFQNEFPLVRKLPGKERHAAIDRVRDRTFNEVIVKYSDRFLDQKQELVRLTVNKNNQFAFQLSIALLALGLCGAGAGALVGYLFSIALRRTVVELSVPIHDAAGKLEEVVGPVTVRGTPTSFHDLQGSLDQVASQVTKVVERLQKSQLAALRAEQLAAVGQMAAGMAHELRNPLTSVKILVQSAHDGHTLSPRDLLVLEEEISRLENLIQTFLDFARPPQAEKHRVDVREVIDDTMRLFQTRADRVDTQVELDIPDVPCWVWGDRTQLHQVLLNLLINSLDAIGRAGKIRIELAGGDVTNAHDSVPRVHLRVIDDGCGLPSELGEKIFEPFVSTKQTGIGMGLSICRRIVEDHGGKISAKAHAQRGTVVEIELPAVKAKVPVTVS
jgi:two-component system sensor histidine kinase HydH